MTRDRSVRLLCWAGFMLCALTCLTLVFVWGNELDTDSLLPVPPAEQTVGPTAGSPTPALPSSVAVAVLAALALVGALPALAPKKLLRFSLALSIGLIGIFAAVTILRLGLLFIPVVAAFAVAFSLLPRKDGARPVRGVPGFERPQTV
ncbi:MAG: hypothetical protein ABIP03_03275 [Aquihabitans sp.]